MASSTDSQKSASQWRLRVYPAALLLALVAALIVATVGFDEDHPDSRLGGDYPAFYGAGAIAVAGDWEELYEPKRQQAEQRGLIDDEGGFLYFSYPPFVAGVYSFLGAIDYRWSFLLHTALMAAALVAAVRLLDPWLRRTGWPSFALVALALAFYPILRAVPGGQNTTLSLLLLSAAARWDHDDKPLLAGLALAGLIFKPQFGVVVFPLLLVARRWRVLGGWIGGVAGLYVVSWVLMGGAWVADWWRQASDFRDLNATANGDNFVSIPGFLENLAGSDATGAIIVGYGLAALVGAAVALFWWRYPREYSLERYALAAAAVVIAAPQTLYYDAGLILLGLVVALPWLGPKVASLTIAAVSVSWLQPVEAILGWSPLGPVAWIATVALVWGATVRPASQPTSV